jgi:hypothetical protein
LLTSLGNRWADAQSSVGLRRAEEPIPLEEERRDDLTLDEENDAINN